MTGVQTCGLPISNEERGALATALGATTVVTPDLVAQHVLERTHGLGADIVYECAGRPDAVQSAVDLARLDGVFAALTDGAPGLVKVLVDPNA